MNRKAQFLTTMQFIMAFKVLFVLSIGIIILLYAANTARVDTSITEDFSNRIYIEQIVYNPSCFAYKDAINGRVDLGIIDYHKLNITNLEKCLTFGETPPIRLRPARVLVDYYDARKKDQEFNTSLWIGAHKSTVRRTFKVYVHNNTQLIPAKITLMINPSLERYT